MVNIIICEDSLVDTHVNFINLFDNYNSFILIFIINLIVNSPLFYNCLKTVSLLFLYEYIHF